MNEETKTKRLCNFPNVILSMYVRGGFPSQPFDSEAFVFYSYALSMTKGPFLLATQHCMTVLTEMSLNTK